MSDTPRTDQLNAGLLSACKESAIYDLMLDHACQLERENADLFARLNERTQSHIHASQRDVQTIQQQAIEIDRLKDSNAEMLESLMSMVVLFEGASGAGANHWEQFAEYRSARAAIAKAKGVQP